MILTVREDGNFFEKIFIVLVSMKFGAVKNSSARSSCPCISSSRLLTLKLFHHVIDFFDRRLTKLMIGKVRVLERFFRKNTEVIFDIRKNLVMGMNNLIKIKIRDLDIPVIMTTISNQVFELLIQLTLSFYLWFGRFSITKIWKRLNIATSSVVRSLNLLLRFIRILFRIDLD